MLVDPDHMEGRILKTSYFGYQAQDGGCKHVVEFVFWFHKGSCEKSTAEVKFQWNKINKLSSICENCEDEKWVCLFVYLDFRAR